LVSGFIFVALELDSDFFVVGEASEDSFPSVVDGAVLLDVEGDCDEEVEESEDGEVDVGEVDSEEEELEEDVDSGEELESEVEELEGSVEEEVKEDVDSEEELVEEADEDFDSVELVVFVVEVGRRRLLLV